MRGWVWGAESEGGGRQGLEARMAGRCIKDPD